MPKVATYGTLRKGGRLSKYYMTEDQYVETTTLDGYQLFDLGSYPCAVYTGNKDDVMTVDIWDVSDAQFQAMKSMEESAGYATKYIQDNMAIFLFTKPYGTHIPSGDYLTHISQ